MPDAVIPESNTPGLTVTRENPMSISLNPNDPRNKAAAYEKARLKGLASWAREEREDLFVAYRYLVDALERMAEAKISQSLIDEIARGAHDEFVDRDHDLRLDIDGENGEPLGPLHPTAPIDLSDLEEFFIPKEAK